MTSDSAANEASSGPSVRAAAIPVTSAAAIATTARPTAGTSQLVRCPASCTVPMQAVFGTVQLAGHHMSWLVPAAGLAVVAMAVADVTGVAAARTLGPGLASFAALSEVIFAVLTAWLLLGQRPAVTQLAGGVFILAGIAAVHADTRPRPAWQSRGARGQQSAAVIRLASAEACHLQPTRRNHDC